MRVALPYPPSVNHYWRMVRTRYGCRVHISREGRRYRTDVCALLAAGGGEPLRGRLAVRIEVRPPDRRRRDLDNVQKAVFDSLQHAGVYEDDWQIDRIEVERGEAIDGGLAIVEIDEIDGCASARGELAMNRLPAFTLDRDFPFPPPLDQYWPATDGRMHLGLEGRRYRERVASILAQYSGPPLEGRLSGHITFNPPDQQRDLDDAIVVMLDALSHGGAFECDDQISDLDIRRGPVVLGGKVVVLAEGAT